MALKSILLAEDSSRDVELVLAALEEHRLANQVEVVRDGAQALDYLYQRGAYATREAGLPVLILLDLKMPKVDGLEILRELKADPKMKVIPIVMMTSSREEQDLARSYELGVNSYIVKPLRFQEFVEALKQLSLYWVLLNEAPPGTSGRIGVS